MELKAIKKLGDMHNTKMFRTINSYLSEWNPIGVPSYLSEDEYKPYVANLINVLGDKAKINKALIEMLKDIGVEKEYLENGSVIKDVMHATDFLYSLRKSL